MVFTEAGVNLPIWFDWGFLFLLILSNVFVYMSLMHHQGSLKSIGGNPSEVYSFQCHATCSCLQSKLRQNATLPFRGKLTSINNGGNSVNAANAANENAGRYPSSRVCKRQSIRPGVSPFGLYPNNVGWEVIFIDVFHVSSERKKKKA